MTEEKGQSVGERLLLLRNQKDMTQEGLAEYLDVSRQSVSKWELNKTLPDVDKLIQLSELYGVSIDYLVKGTVSEKFEMIEDSEKEEDKEEDGISREKEAGERDLEYTAKKVIFLIAMLFSGVLFVIAFIFTANLFCRHVFSFEDKEHDYVVINKIYEQYTKAEIWSENEGGDYSRKTVWLDIPGVREDDFVDSYISKDEQGNVFFEYYGRTLIMCLIVCIVLLIFTIVFGMGWKMTVDQKEAAKYEKE